VPALVELVVVDELRIRTLCPTARGWIELVGKDAHGNGNADVFRARRASEKSSC
jgi:hypothetical protein